MSRCLLFTIALSCVFLFQAMPIQAQDDRFVVSALQAGNDIAWSQMTVRIVDPDGQPIPGATVRPWALAAGGHGAWNEKRYGSPRTTTTDGEGKAIVVFPESIQWSHKNINRVTLVSLDVRHPDFCAENVHTNVPQGDAVPEIRLTRGTKIKVAGVKPGSHEPLPDCYVEFEGHQSVGLEFVREPNGWLQSVPLKENQRWFQLVYMPPGELPQFSLPQAWNPNDPGSLERMVVVQPGVRVIGKISENVPRPIRRGFVVVTCGSPAHPDEEGLRKANEPISWRDYAPIAEDGAFEFASLPSGTLGQFFAYANDSISAQPSIEAYETCCTWFGLNIEKQHASFRYGQILRLPRGKVELNIEMELAGQVRVKCTDRAGTPLKGLYVTSWPNQYTVAAGSTIFCSLNSSQDFLRNQNLGDMSELWKRTPYVAQTNEDGIALITNLPKGKQSFSAWNERWETKGSQVAISNPGEATPELTIQLERKD